MRVGVWYPMSTFPVSATLSERVVDVLEQGYTYKSKVVVVARVVVASE